MKYFCRDCKKRFPDLVAFSEHSCQVEKRKRIIKEIVKIQAATLTSREVYDRVPKDKEITIEEIATICFVDEQVIRKKLQYLCTKNDYPVEKTENGFIFRDNPDLYVKTGQMPEDVYQDLLKSLKVKET